MHGLEGGICRPSLPLAVLPWRHCSWNQRWQHFHKRQTLQPAGVPLLTAQCWGGWWQHEPFCLPTLSRYQVSSWVLKGARLLISDQATPHAFCPYRLLSCVAVSWASRPALRFDQVPGHCGSGHQQWRHVCATAQHGCCARRQAATAATQVCKAGSLPE